MRKLAIGGAWLVAACWSGPPASAPTSPPPPPPQASAPTSPPPPPPEPTPPVTFAAPPPSGGPTPTTPPTPSATISPASCGVDEVFETLCGGMGRPGGAGSCGPTADTNASWGWQRLVVTSLTKGRADPALKEFVLDATETAAYQASTPPSGRGLPGPFCCHSRCTPLVVATSAPVVKPSRGYHAAERCIPPPTAGTAAPAKRDASCPAAVELAGQLVPYAGSHAPPGPGSPWWYRANGGKACCYSTIERDPPPPHRDGCPTCKCAAVGTPIATPAGEVAIETLVAGDVVLSMDHGALRAVPLVAVHRERVLDHVVVVITLATGRTVAMSPNHPTADGRVFGDVVVGSRLGDANVIAVERVPYAGEYTYDILPASDSGTYVAAGALVGSTLRHAD